MTPYVPALQQLGAKGFSSFVTHQTASEMLMSDLQQNHILMEPQIRSKISS